MAYSLGDRFSPTGKCYKLFDPGAYQSCLRPVIKPNKVAFLSNTPRSTDPGTKIWTHAIYNTHISPTIPNCTTIKSKCPRFSYPALTEEDLEEILCRCGIQNKCECSVEEDVEIPCQAKLRRRIFKGPPGHYNLSNGLSTPSKRHCGFEVLADGSMKQILEVISDESPCFYETRVNEATAFYRGCKWSKWKSIRSPKLLEVRPGPADYHFETKSTQSELCTEKIRAYRRKTSKQLRFIEMVQRRNLLETRPGPADYNPMPPKGTDLQFTGCKTERFQDFQQEMRPSPTTYWVKRDFDPPQYPGRICRAMLPKPAGFGMKAPRFRTTVKDGPGPANYCPKSNLCKFTHCQIAPFNSTTKRFKSDPIPSINNSEDDEDTNDEESSGNIKKKCPLSTWVFKSRTERIKPLKKKLDEPSPADLLLQSMVGVKRSPELQYTAPFNSSEGRFQPWYNWMSVCNRVKTPGPCYYKLEKPKRYPTLPRGPLVRSRRFVDTRFSNLAPNEYKVCRGIETVLNTHNKRLRKNIETQHKFHWKPRLEQHKTSYSERESLLLSKTIALLNVDEDSKLTPTSVANERVDFATDKKLLRCFLYRKPIPHYY